MLYFAYGANMTVSEMQDRCPGAIPLGKATLPNWRTIINARGYASIVRVQGEQSSGLLWVVSEENLCSLDRYEGVAGGLYRRITTTTDDGRSVQAYEALDGRLGVARTRYMEDILTARKALGLPAQAIFQWKFNSKWTFRWADSARVHSGPTPLAVLRSLQSEIPMMDGSVTDWMQSASMLCPGIRTDSHEAFLHSLILGGQVCIPALHDGPAETIRALV